MGKIIRGLKSEVAEEDRIIVNSGSRLDRVIAQIKAKERKATIIVVCFLCVIFLTFCYIMFSSVQKLDEYHTIKTTHLEINYDDGTNEFGDVINLTGENAGNNKSASYNVSISNVSDEVVYYTLSIIQDDEMIDFDGCRDKLISKSDIRYRVSDMAALILEGQEEVISGFLKAGENVNYKLEVWVDLTKVSYNGHYHGRIVVKEKKD